MIYVIKLILKSPKFNFMLFVKSAKSYKQSTVNFSAKFQLLTLVLT